MTPQGSSDTDNVTLFLCGDVMLGRGIDQVLPHPSQAHLYEPYVRSATEYVAMAESAHGPIPKPIPFSYVWGDAVEELGRMAPSARVVNLETSVTTSEDYVRKGINYRMHPANIPCLAAAKIDCCVLANNHVLDWGRSGLVETVETLQRAGMKTTGAGRNPAEAAEPAVIAAGPHARVLVFGVGATDSGIPTDWAATEKQPGVALLPDFSQRTVDRTGASVAAVKRPGDVAVLSVHWGANWGYEIPGEHRAFAHRLIDLAGVDVIHGHSSHHPKGIEIYRGKPIFYGCGDFLNDYEGIAGYEEFRSHLVLMYFATIDPHTGHLMRLEMTPLETRRFRLQRASVQDSGWLQDMLNREGRALGPQVILNAANRLVLQGSGVR